MCNNKGTKNFRLVIVDITSTGVQELSLKDEENLREAKRIVAVEAYRVANVSTTPDGKTVVNDTVFKKSFLTLSTPAGPEEKVYNLPLSDLDRTANNGQLFYVDIPPIAPTKCRIKIGSIAGLVAGEAFLLGFHYEQ